MSAVPMKLRIFKNKSFTSFLRLYSTGKQKVTYKYTKFEPDHPYNNLYPWKTRDQFVDAIEKSVIYNKDGLIAINKPFGVPVNESSSPGRNDNRDTKDSNPRVIKQTLVTSDIPECNYSIKEILPILSTRLNLESLSIIKSPERFTSGIMLLTSSKKNADAISIALRRSMARKLPPFRYWAITTFIPPHADEKLEKVGIKLVDVKEFQEKVPVIQDNISRSAIKIDAVTPVFTKLKILSFNKMFNTALVELETSKTTMHFLRVLMAHKLAPVLGDGMYSGRVKTVLGKPVAVSPFNQAAYDTKILSDNLCRQLQLPPEKTGSIPTHLHLHQVTLTGYAKKQDLILNCSPVQYFTWSLNRLGLEQDTLNQVERIASN